MNKASRNVASVNGADQQEVVTSLQADLQLAREVAQGNYDIAEQLGGALEIAEGKISALQARVEELQEEVMRLLPYSQSSDSEDTDVVQHIETFKAVKGVKAKKAKDEEVSV